MASVLYVTNTTATDVANNAIVPLGTAVHKSCGSLATLQGNNIVINGAGYFRVDVNAVVTAATAGDVQLEVRQNSGAVPGATATETITTANTEFRTLSISTELFIRCNCPTTVSVYNTGIASSIENITVTVKRDA